MSRWFVGGILLILVVGSGGAAGNAAAVCNPPPAGPRVFLPAVARGDPAAARRTPLATLGPSPTATRTPTGGPTPAPTAVPTAGPTTTPGPTFAVLTAGCPYWVGAGATVVFTVGLVNAQDVPVQVSLEDTVPTEMQITRVYAAVTPTVTAGHFTLQMVVPPQRTENVFVLVTVTDVCHCYVENAATWFATWNGGSNSGTVRSNAIYVTGHPSPTPTSTAPAVTRTPSGVPTLGPSATPAATVPALTRTPTSVPTLGPSPTPTPGR